MFINEGIFVWAKIPFKDFALKTHYLFVANYYFMLEASVV